MTTGSEEIIYTDEGISITVPSTCEAFTVASEYAYMCDSISVSDSQIVVKLPGFSGVVTITPNVAEVYDFAGLTEEDEDNNIQLQGELEMLASVGSEIEELVIDDYRGTLQRYGFPEGCDECVGTGAQGLIPYGSNKLLEIRFTCTAYNSQEECFEIDDLLESDDVISLLSGISLSD